MCLWGCIFDEFGCVLLMIFSCVFVVLFLCLGYTFSYG